MGNRRTNMPRIKSHFPVRYWTGDARTSKDGQAVNISPTGLFVATEHREPPNVKVTIDLAFPGPEIVRLRGFIAWSRYQPRQFEWVSENGFGVQIEDAPEDWFRHIEELQRKAKEREEDRQVREQILGKRR